VDRETFNHGEPLDGEDPAFTGFKRVIYSYGNRGWSYLFGEEAARAKSRAHQFVVFDELLENYPSELIKKVRDCGAPTCWKVINRRQAVFANHCRKIKNNPNLERLQQLEQLDRLQRLGSQERLKKVEILNKSYLDLEIPPNAVVYCDPPYFGTETYKNNIDHEEFYKWAKALSNPVYISGYKMPPEFKLVKEIRHQAALSSIGNTQITERLFQA
jgi:16S rRNA G966 N2-methylase RsmD